MAKRTGPIITPERFDFLLEEVLNASFDHTSTLYKKFHPLGIEDPAALEKEGHVLWASLETAIANLRKEVVGDD